MVKAMKSHQRDTEHVRHLGRQGSGAANRLALVALAAVALGGCERTTAPTRLPEDTAASEPVLALGTTTSTDRVAAAVAALNDAARRIVPTLADERLAGKVGVSLDMLALRLPTADPVIVRLALDVARAAVDYYAVRASTAAVEAPDLDAIRLALGMVAQLLPPVTP